MADAGPSNNGTPGGAPGGSPEGARQEGAPEGGIQEGSLFRGKPLSPWAERFGILDETYDFGDGRHHSGRAPLYPMIDALNYYDIAQKEPVEKPDDADLDRLFLTERFQGTTQTGLLTWQLGALK